MKILVISNIMTLVGTLVVGQLFFGSFVSNEISANPKKENLKSLSSVSADERGAKTNRYSGLNENAEQPNGVASSKATAMRSAEVNVESELEELFDQIFFAADGEAVDTAALQRLASDPSGLELLIKNYPQLSSFNQRDAVLSALESEGNAQTQEFFRLQVKQGGSWEKAYAVEVLSKSELIAQDSSILYEIADVGLASSSSEVVSSALYALSENVDRSSAVWNEALLVGEMHKHSEDVDVRGMSLKLLAELGSDNEKNEFNAFVSDGLSSDDSYHVYSAIDAVFSADGLITDKSIATKIESLVLDDTVDSDTRSFALAALSKLKEEQRSVN